MIYRGLMMLSWLVCRLPHWFLLGLGRIFGNLYYVFIRKQRELAIAQMMRGLNIEREAAETLVRASFVNLATNVFEILYMPHLNERNLSEYIEIEHLERMREALAEGRGVIVVTGHIGTWEWLSAAFSLNGMPVTAIAKPQPNEQYTRVLNDLRKTIHVEIFSRGTSELLAAGRALRSGKILGFLSDQDAGPGGAFIEFLGKVASTPMGAAVFARKFKAPILPAFILRREDGRHRVVIGERLGFIDTGDAERDLYDLTARAAKILERVIIENPTQWLWFQKRWNTPPEMRHVKHHVN